jgi:hypothetical protein
MRAEWERAFVNESGHALMAVLQGIPCEGIYLERISGKFCTLTPLPSPGELSRKDYLFIAASTAAEIILYKSPKLEGAESDRKYFEISGAPSRDEVVSEALAILLSRRKQLERLVSLLKTKVRESDSDLTRLPTTGTDNAFAVLLSKKELEEALPPSGL